MNKKRSGYLFILPAMGILIAITVYPFLYNLRLSFFQWQLTKTDTIGPFVGLDNYAKVIDDPFFHNSLRVTAVFLLGSVGLETFSALLIALLLSRERKFNRIIKRILIFPFVIAPALIGYSWRFFLNPEFGVVDYLLKFFLPINKRLVWLADRYWAMGTLILVDMWQWTPFITLIFMAGLSSIPQDLIEVAETDGANKLQILRFVTLPLLLPTLAVALIIKTIFSLKEFDKVFLLTKGGPGRATELVGYYIYRTGLWLLNMGEAAAISFLLAIIVTILVTLYLKILPWGST